MKAGTKETETGGAHMNERFLPHHVVNDTRGDDVTHGLCPVIEQRWCVCVYVCAFRWRNLPI